MKKVIVTDPCYLISNEDWDKLISKCESKAKNNWHELFGSEVGEFLKNISGDKLAIADNTGYGDWANEIDEKEFYADSGMVCVCEYTNKLKEYLEKNNINLLPNIAAIVPVEDNSTYEIDRSEKQWSVVRIYSGKREIHSLETDDIVD